MKTHNDPIQVSSRISSNKLKKHWFAFYLILAFNVLFLLMWHTNPYRYPVLGAIFEILWIFMIASVLINPIIAFIYWLKDKFSLRSKFLYLLTWTLLTIAYLLFIYVNVRAIYLTEWP